MPNIIEQAVQILRAGGLVAFPTETVYGLGADATNVDALRKIFTAKGRPIDHPLIVHLAHINQLPLWACDVSEAAYLLAKAFWPGPLTLILKKGPDVSYLVTGGQESIGLRIPAHPIALALLTAINTGLAAPSANRFGRISPTTAQAVEEELGDKVDLILEGGECAVGLESTIVDMRGDVPIILRPGMITREQLEVVLKQPVASRPKNNIRVSGNLASHYSPCTPLQLMTIGEIQDFLGKLNNKNTSHVILARQGIETNHSQVQIVVMPNNPQQYAHDLYSTLREVDHQSFQTIIVERVPATSEWMAIEDRLMRASQRF